MYKNSRQRKQAERDKKLADEILTGKVKVYYEPPKKKSQANRIGGATGEEGAKEVLAEQYMRLLGLLIPGILAMFSTVEDLRALHKTKHKLPALILYGIIMFMSQTSSRREANREIGGSEVAELIQRLVPEFTSMPHADTLARLLEVIDPGTMEKQYEELVREFVKSDFFKAVNPGQIIVLADGTMKFVRDYCWDERALSRNAGNPEKETYYAYMMESVLILNNGMVLPLLTETMENGERLDGDKAKQDCETKAFKRLAARLVKLLGKGRVTMVLDGLYATGPMMSTCTNYGWEFMITLKRGCLNTVWEDYEGLQKIEKENTLEARWGERYQLYHWSNDIEYIYGNNNKKLILNVVTCRESCYGINPKKSGKPSEKHTDFAWLSSSRVNAENVFRLCTEIARRRWYIENHFLTLKHQGYSYSHCFSLNWNAMKGFHCLAKFANFINAFITCSQNMGDYIIAEGIKGVVKKAWTYIKEHGLPDGACSIAPVCIDDNGRRPKIRFRQIKLKHTA
jgi:hypothetical protein